MVETGVERTELRYTQEVNLCNDNGLAIVHDRRNEQG